MRRLGKRRSALARFAFCRNEKNFSRQGEGEAGDDFGADAEDFEEEVGGEDFGGFAGGTEAAFVHHDDGVEDVGHAEVVQGEEERAAGSGVLVAEEEDFESVSGVEGGKGFVPELEGGGGGVRSG